MDQSLFDRVPPHSLDAERAVLGACLLDADVLMDMTETLGADDFYDPKYKVAFEVIADMVREGRPVDSLTFAQEVSNKGLEETLGGQAFIAAVVDSVPTTANALYHAKIVREKALRRRLIRVGGLITRLGFTEDRDLPEILDESEKLIFELAQKGTTRDISHIKEVIPETIVQIQENFRRGEMVTGTASGYGEFDLLTGGLQPGSLNIVAARPSMGKTALALNIAQYAAVRGEKPVLIFSLEMSAEQLAQRMLGSEGRINIHDLRTGNFPEKSWKTLGDAADRLSGAPIYIDDGADLSTLEMRARCRRFMSRVGEVGLIVVDYLQLMRLSRNVESKQQEVSEISRALKAVARELNVPVMALSQLSRAVEQRTDKRPQLSDLRDSGAIEQDADVVILLHREDMYDSQNRAGEADLIVAKHRNGPTGKVELYFDPERLRFMSIDKDHQDN